MKPADYAFVSFATAAILSVLATNDRIYATIQFFMWLALGVVLTAQYVCNTRKRIRNYVRDPDRNEQLWT